MHNWQYWGHIETLVRYEQATKLAERYDLGTRSWLAIDGNWVLEKLFAGDAYLDALSKSQANYAITKAKRTGAFSF